VAYAVRRLCSDFMDMLWRLISCRIIIIIIINLKHCFCEHGAHITVTVNVTNSFRSNIITTMLSTKHHFSYAIWNTLPTSPHELSIISSFNCHFKDVFTQMFYFSTSVNWSLHVSRLNYELQHVHHIGTPVSSHQHSFIINLKEQYYAIGHYWKVYIWQKP